MESTRFEWMHSSCFSLVAEINELRSNTNQGSVLRFDLLMQFHFSRSWRRNYLNNWSQIRFLARTPIDVYVIDLSHLICLRTCVCVCLCLNWNCIEVGVACVLALFLVRYLINLPVSRANQLNRACNQWIFHGIDHNWYAASLQNRVCSTYIKLPCCWAHVLTFNRLIGNSKAFWCWNIILVCATNEWNEWYARQRNQTHQQILKKKQKNTGK